MLDNVNNLKKLNEKTETTKTTKTQTNIILLLNKCENKLEIDIKFLVSKLT